jgi:2-keto-4-pentenoate hydratase/2-oxohepta-3-ene-1,7-dioic acid hydratase in catechol pathway
MKITRFLSAGREHLGRLHDDGHATVLEGDLFAAAGLHDTGTPAQIDKLLAPVEPRDILCVGLNYKQHAAESGAEPPAHPVLFLKNSGAVQNPGDPIVLPRRLRSDEVDYECELAVVIGKRCHNVARADALAHMLGYTCANDVSARDWQKKGGGGSGAAARPLPPSARWAPRSSPPTRFPIPINSASARCSMARRCRTGTRAT